MSIDPKYNKIGLFVPPLYETASPDNARNLGASGSTTFSSSSPHLGSFVRTLLWAGHLLLIVDLYLTSPSS